MPQGFQMIIIAQGIQVEVPTEDNEWLSRDDVEFGCVLFSCFPQSIFGSNESFHSVQRLEEFFHPKGICNIRSAIRRPNMGHQHLSASSGMDVTQCHCCIW